MSMHTHMYLVNFGQIRTMQAMCLYSSVSVHPNIGVHLQQLPQSIADVELQIAATMLLCNPCTT